MPRCGHLELIRYVVPPADPEGCEECLKTDDPWVHLRMCMTCGAIRCCDSSPNRHARRHAEQEGHPVVRSAEPGEDWSWCYEDELMFVVQAPDG
jgi:uncharacterized UBP type Zn finger protein